MSDCLPSGDISKLVLYCVVICQVGRVLEGQECQSSKQRICRADETRYEVYVHVGFGLLCPEEVY